MLVLSRKLGQKVCVGDDIVISVERIDSNRVRIGIVAPREITIVRSEILGRVDSVGDGSDAFEQD